MTVFWMLWWIWLGAAIVLAILEIVLPGFILLGFAIGAAITGLLLLLPGFAPTLPILLLVFAGLSLAAWLLLRKVFATPFGQVKNFDHDIND